jgi:putative nucleotide binding protein
MPNEEISLVLDYLAQGRSSDYKREPLAQVIGTEHFTLLEVVPKETLKIMDKVYVGKEKREQIDHIKRRIGFKDLTATAQAELPRAIETIIRDDNERFLGFYNKSSPITIKRHQLELLPGLGKKHMQDLLKERHIKPFESYEDITKRVKLMPDPIQALVKRVIEELEGVDIKYYLFARPPAREKPRFFKPRRFEPRTPREPRS